MKFIFWPAKFYQVYISLRSCMAVTWSSQAKYTALHFLGVPWSIHPEERDFHLNLLTECPCEQVWWNAKPFPNTSMLLIISQWFLTWPLAHKSCHSDLFCRWLKRLPGLHKPVLLVWVQSQWVGSSDTVQLATIRLCLLHQPFRNVCLRNQTLALATSILRRWKRGTLLLKEGRRNAPVFSARWVQQYLRKEKEVMGHRSVNTKLDIKRNKF